MILLPWTRQPVGPVEPNWSDTRLAGATGLWRMEPGARNLISGEPTALQGSAYFGVGPSGQIARTVPNTGRIQLASDSRNLLSDVGSTTIALHYRKIGAAAATGGFGLDASATAIIRAGAHFPFSDGTVYWDFGGNTAGTSRLTAAGLTFTDDYWVFTTGPAGMEIWQNGIRRAQQAGFATWTSSSQAYLLGMHGTASNADDAECAVFLTVRRQWSPAESASWTAEGAWSVFKPSVIYVQAGAGGVTGTLSKTNANDTSAASGTTTVVGSVAKTNANDTSAASGTTTVLGTLAKTNANDTSAASGTVGSGGSTGTVSYTNANDTVVASGKTTIIGVLSKTNANDSVVAAGWAGRITGTLAKTNANDTVSASGTSGTAPAASAAERVNGLDWATIVAKTLGKDYDKPEYVYEFSNGRRFVDKKNPYA